MQYLKKLEEEQGLKPEGLLELSLTLQPEPLQLTEATQGEFLLTSPKPVHRDPGSDLWSWGYSREPQCSEEGKDQVLILGQMLAIVLRLSGVGDLGPALQRKPGQNAQAGPHPDSPTMKTRKTKSQEVQSRPG